MVNGIQFHVQSYKQNTLIIFRLSKNWKRALLNYVSQRLFINSSTYKICQDFRCDKNKTRRVGKCPSLICHDVKSMVLSALILEATDSEGFPSVT